MNWVAVFLGGGLGSLARFLVSKGVLSFSSPIFPWATLISNLISCLILILAINYFQEKEIIGWQKSFIMIGFCGGFSTFSTFSLETFQLLKQGNSLFAGLNILVSVLLCLFVFWIIHKNVSLNP